MRIRIRTVIAAVNRSEWRVQKAKQGDTVAAKFIVERILGRPQTIDLSLVAIKARIEEMRAESDEASQKEIMKLSPLIS